MNKAVLPQTWWILGSAGGTGCAGNCPLGYLHCTPYHKSCKLSLRTASVLHPIGTSEGTHMKVYRQVVEILSWCFANTYIFPVATFAFQVHKTQCSTRTHNVQTYDNQLVVPLLVSPSANSSIFSWSSSLYWHYRARGSAAGSCGLHDFLKPPEQQQKKQIRVPLFALTFVKICKLFFLCHKSHILHSMLIIWILF